MVGIISNCEFEARFAATSVTFRVGTDTTIITAPLSLIQPVALMFRACGVVFRRIADRQGIDDSTTLGKSRAKLQRPAGVDPDAVAGLTSGATGPDLASLVPLSLHHGAPKPVRAHMKLEAAGVLVSRPRLVVRVATLQPLLRAFDGLTIWVCFLAIGVEAPPRAAIAALVIGNAGMFVTPVPTGPRAFDAGTAATLAVAGLPSEPALTATLLSGGISLWIPLIPGYYNSQLELRRNNARTRP